MGKMKRSKTRVEGEEQSATSENGGKKAIVIGIGIALLMALYNGAGYVGNAITDPAHSGIWWGIVGFVGLITFVIEITSWSKKRNAGVVS